jgi:lipopolysaccharide/colanic/teichoic acid biosynthesis glycosyltransferase
MSKFFTAIAKRGAVIMPSRQNMVTGFNKAANQVSDTSVAVAKNAPSFILNRGVGVVGLAASAPLFVIAAGTTFLFIDKKDIFYTENRLGKNGKTIKLRKFKTMHDAPKNLRNDPRLQDLDSKRTPRAGEFLRKTRLDELPQLLNLINGEMKIFGHRAQPDKPEYKNILQKFPLLWQNQPGFFSAKMLQPEFWRVTINQPDFEPRFAEACAFDTYGIETSSKIVKASLLPRNIGVMLLTNSTGSEDENNTQPSALQPYKDKIVRVLQGSMYDNFLAARLHDNSVIEGDFTRNSKTQNPTTNNEIEITESSDLPLPKAASAHVISHNSDKFQYNPPKARLPY